MDNGDAVDMCTYSCAFSRLSCLFNIKLNGVNDIICCKGVENGSSNYYKKMDFQNICWDVDNSANILYTNYSDFF